MLDSLLFATSAVAPIILTVAVGYILKRAGLFPASLATAINKLVFRVFLPCMLFLNVYSIGRLRDVEPGYLLYAAGITLLIFLLSLPLSGLFTKEKNRRGVLSQCTFRSNFALIGIPLVESLYGSAGVAGASLLSAVSIPLFNMLAVVALSLFGSGEKKPTVKSVLLGILKNPLIQAVFAGIAVLCIREGFYAADVSFRLSDLTPIWKTLGYLANAATPLALLSLGAQFEFATIGGMKREIVAGTVARTVLTPIIGMGIALLCFDFTPAQYASFVALFTTPVAVSTVPMAQEMGGDSDLAGQLVVWTTLVSAVSLFVLIYGLRFFGVL